MAGKSGKTLPQTPPSGKDSQTTKPELAGKVLPVVNPMDLWYLCQKVDFAEAHPLINIRGHKLKQRQVSRWVHQDCELNKWVWPYWGEVGFDMKLGTDQPPEAIMSRKEPFRPSSMPLSRYRVLRENALDAGVMSSLDLPLLTKDFLEDNLSPEQFRRGRKLAIADDMGYGWKYGKPKIKGLLRIPDVIRLIDFETEKDLSLFNNAMGTARFAASNIAYLIEIKFDGDELSSAQRRDYFKIVNKDRNKFRLLETKVCKIERRRRRWLEDARRKCEPVFQSVEAGVTLSERLLKWRAQIPAAAILVDEMHTEQRTVANLFMTIAPPHYKGITAELRPWDPAEAARQEQARQRGRDEVALVLDAPFFVEGVGALGAGALAPAAEAGATEAVLGDAPTLVARGTGTLINFPIGSIAVGIAANAAIYEAAARPSASSKTAAVEAAQGDEYMWRAISQGYLVTLVYLAD